MLKLVVDSKNSYATRITGNYASEITERGQKN